MKRDFEAWLENFRPMIADYSYYIDFNKVIANTDAIRDELNLLNGLIGKQDIEAEFIRITQASLEESHPHDLFITNPGENYK